MIDKNPVQKLCEINLRYGFKTFRFYEPSLKRCSFFDDQGYLIGYLSADPEDINNGKALHWITQQFPPKWEIRRKGATYSCEIHASKRIGIEAGSMMEAVITVYIGLLEFMNGHTEEARS